MEIGDQVVVTGTVRDVVNVPEVANGGNVLVVTDDGREYWFLVQHVQLQPTAGAELTAATAQVEKAESSDPNYQNAVNQVMSKGYTEDQAKAIVAQIGVDAALKV